MAGTTSPSNINRFLPKLQALLVAVALLVGSCAKSQVPARQSVRWGTKVLPNSIAVPASKIISPQNGTLAVGSTASLPSWLQNEFAPVAASFAQTLQQHGTGSATQLTVRVMTEADFQRIQGQLPANFANKDESYFLEIKPSGINLYGGSKLGVIHGLTTLQDMIASNYGTLECAQHIDWPDLEVRAIHIVMKMLSPEVLKSMIDRARNAHFNTVILSTVNAVSFKALGKLAKPYAITPQEFKDVVQYARASGLEVVPQISCLSHQDRELIRKEVHPDLLYNDRTYDPRKPGVYNIVLPLFDEIIALIQPQAIHIGHDEVVGHNQKQIDLYGEILPAHLYLKDVQILNQHLQAKGVDVWMWSDMLVVPDEFPTMHPGSLNGTADYVAMRDSLPRNIVLCDWHYKHYRQKLAQSLDFPTANLFADMGFPVLGASWNVPEVTAKFGQYVWAEQHPNLRGMIATTWSYTLKGATTNNKATDNYQSVDAIISHSGNAFWNASQVDN